MSIRQSHLFHNDGGNRAFTNHLPWLERFRRPTEYDDAVTRMKRRLKTKDSRALREQAVVPVLRIIKSVIGSVRFLLRRLEALHDQRSAVTMASNIH